MSFMKNTFTTILLFLYFLLTVVPALSQTKEQKKEQKVFAAIPQHLRARLVERLNSYVEYEHTKQYEKLYDLLFESVAKPSSLSLEEYVTASKKTFAEGYRTNLLKFKPTNTLDFSPDNENKSSYQIFGVAKVDDGEEVYVMNAAIIARWINGEWYFSSLASVIYD
jgi:hypothetical protein